LSRYSLTVFLNLCPTNTVSFFIFKKQLFALKYTLKYLIIKINLLALLHVSVLSDHPQGVVVPGC